MRKLISVVIPVYKSADSLYELAEQVQHLQERMDWLFEVVFVNDSPGYARTEVALSEISSRFGRMVKVIHLRKNTGQHLALLVGIRAAKGECIVTMDDDLQHPVHEIPCLIRALEENPGVEAVFGVPAASMKKHSVWRKVASNLLNKVDVLFLDKPRGLKKSSFRIMTRDLARLIAKNHNASPAVSCLIINMTHQIINVEVDHCKRAYGESHYSVRKLLSLTLDNILHYSSFPLRLVGMTGVAGFLFALIFIVFIICRKLFFGLAVPGYASTVSLISFFGGLNLLGVALIGEYLIRIAKEQQKPDLDDYVRNK